MLDSIILQNAVATQDTVTQLLAAIRRVAREVSGAAEMVAARCTAHDYGQPGKPAIGWTTPGPHGADECADHRRRCSVRVGVRSIHR